MDARKDSTAFMPEAKVVTLKDIEREAPKPQHAIRLEDVDGICRQLKSLRQAPNTARAFLAAYEKRVDGRGQVRLDGGID